jgi:hypothetical protein
MARLKISPSCSLVGSNAGSARLTSVMSFTLPGPGSTRMNKTRIRRGERRHDRRRCSFGAGFDRVAGLRWLA